KTERKQRFLAANRMAQALFSALPATFLCWRLCLTKNSQELLMNRSKSHRNRPLLRWLTALGVTLSLVGGILTSDNASAQSVESSRAATREKSKSSGTVLAKYTRDLSTAAERGRFSSLTDRSEER